MSSLAPWQAQQGRQGGRLHLSRCFFRAFCVRERVESFSKRFICLPRCLQQPQKLTKNAEAAAMQERKGLVIELRQACLISPVTLWHKNHHPLPRSRE